jgi:hypothetical protein
MKVYELLEKLKGVDELKSVGVETHVVNRNIDLKWEHLRTTLNDLAKVSDNILPHDSKEKLLSLKAALAEFPINEDLLETSYYEISDAKSVNGTMKFELTV